MMMTAGEKTKLPALILDPHQQKGQVCECGVACNGTLLTAFTCQG